MNLLRLTSSLLVLVALSTPWASAQTADTDLAYYEKTLKDAKCGTEGEPLLDVLRARSLNDKDRAQLKEKVQLLGNRSFAVREKTSKELRAAGRIALPFLKSAVTDPDNEIRKRALALIEEIESNSDSPVVAAALYLIALRQPKGSLEALLGYLPSITDDSLTESVYTSLATVGVKNGTVDPLLLAALKDGEESRRAAAASIYAKVPPDTTKKALAPLLRDRSTLVRYRAGRSLLQAGDRTAMSAMLELLTDGTPEQAVLVEDLLFSLGAEKSPTVTVQGDAEARKRARNAWEGWWRVNGEQTDLKKLTDLEAVLGLTLVCEPFLPSGGGRVFELDAAGRKMWEVKSSTPLDAQVLPGGRVLIADHNGFVHELDKEGKVHWKYDIPNPVSVRRLPNGNTFIVSYTRVVEVTRDGKEVYRIDSRNTFYYGLKLKTGNILCVSSGNTVLEFDTTGKEVHRVTVPSTGGWGCVQLLPNGNYLVACSGAHQVVEVDRAGKVIWKQSVNNPMSARRLRNGNTLVASHDDRHLYEYDAAGKIVWRYKVEGYPFQAHRR